MCVWLMRLWRTVVQGLMQTLPWEKVSSLSSNFALSTSHAKSWVCLKTPRFTGHFGESKKLVILAKAKKVSRPLMSKHEMMPPWPLYSGHLGDYKHCSFNFDSKHDVNIWTISLWSDLTLACFCVNIDISDANYKHFILRLIVPLFDQSLDQGFYMYCVSSWERSLHPGEIFAGCYHTHIALEECPRILDWGKALLALYFCD